IFGLGFLPILLTLLFGHSRRRIRRNRGISRMRRGRAHRVRQLVIPLSLHDGEILAHQGAKSVERLSSCPKALEVFGVDSLASDRAPRNPLRMKWNSASRVSRNLVLLSRLLRRLWVCTLNFLLLCHTRSALLMLPPI